VKSGWLQVKLTVNIIIVNHIGPRKIYPNFTKVIIDLTVEKIT